MVTFEVQKDFKDLLELLNTHKVEYMRAAFIRLPYFLLFPPSLPAARTE
jgi:hypothetical protein